MGQQTDKAEKVYTFWAGIITPQGYSAELFSRGRCIEKYGNEIDLQPHKNQYPLTPLVEFTSQKNEKKYAY